MDTETKIEIDRRILGFFLSLIPGVIILGFSVESYVRLLTIRNYFFSPRAELLLTLLIIFSLLLLLGSYLIWQGYQIIGGDLAIFSSISSIILFIIHQGRYGLKYIPPFLLSPSFLIIFSMLGIIGGVMNIKGEKNKNQFNMNLKVPSLNEKLQQLGKKLNISKKDIDKVKAASSNSKKVKLRWILEGILSIISFIVGFFLGRSYHPTFPSARGYPFATGLTTLKGLHAARKRSQRVQVFRILLNTIPLLALLLGLMFGLEIGPSPYPKNIMYGVNAGKEATSKRN